MPGYRMYFLTTENHIAYHLEHACEDDDSALSKARDLATLRDSVIDVWQTDRRVATVRPESGPPVFSDHRAP